MSVIWRICLVNRDVDVDAVAGEFGYLGVSWILSLPRPRYSSFRPADRLIECRLIKVLRLRQPERFEVFLNGVVCSSFAPVMLNEPMVGRSITVSRSCPSSSFDAYVVKETGGVQALMMALPCVSFVGIADFDGQVVEYGARLGTLQAFDTDVLDGEVGKCQRRMPNIISAEAICFSFIVSSLWCGMRFQTAFRNVKSNRAAG